MDALRTPPSRGRSLVRPIFAIGAIAVGVPLVLAGCGSDNTATQSSTASALLTEKQLSEPADTAAITSTWRFYAE